MWLFTNITSSNPDYTADCDYAAILLTPEVLNALRTRQALFRHGKTLDPTLSSLTFRNPQLFIFANADLTAHWSDWDTHYREQLSNDAWVVVPSLSFDPFAIQQRLEFAQSHLNETDAWWTAVPKYTSLEVESERIPLSTLLDPPFYLTVALQDPASSK